ncbi:DUF397 domain-containing protein [Streptomyces sp. NPDC007929]|uniref:DUF397 domain-containing protein n=1 Tax=unclassified Streptomyces TaxID=2593676 RepID=UPI0036EA6CBF
MDMVINGGRVDEISGVRWVKATASDAIGECVEVAHVNESDVALRNSRFPEGPALVFTRAEFAAFLDGAGRGEFDGLTV